MPNLENIILTNNKITDFEEITNLKNCTKLERLSLINNPITSVIYFLKGTKL
jgi:U2 small nuclear ribonucleoprotein A'